MSIIGNATIIRGKGACELFINDIRDEEVHRINELHEKEIELMKTELRKTKDRMRMMPAVVYKKERLAKKTIDLRCYAFERPNFFQKCKAFVGFVWACIWVLGLRLKLWAYNDEAANEHFWNMLRTKR